MAEYMKTNKHLTLEVSMRRNYHPYMSSTYINGYVKDQPLRSMTAEEVLNWFTKVNKEFGKRPLKHKGRENLTE